MICFSRKLLIFLCLGLIGGSLPGNSVHAGSVNSETSSEETEIAEGEEGTESEPKAVDASILGPLIRDIP